MTIHKLKTWTEYYEQVEKGLKPFEVRKSDRDYKLGDYLLLQEWNPDTEYTGREHLVRVTYILYGGKFGIEEGYCVMGIQRIPHGDRLPFSYTYYPIKDNDLDSDNCLYKCSKCGKEFTFNIRTSPPNKINEVIQHTMDCEDKDE